VISFLMMALANSTLPPVTPALLLLANQTETMIVARQSQYFTCRGEARSVKQLVEEGRD
jgi:hypothetical protein